MSDVKKFLVVKLSSIGDIVHAMPAVAALRRAFPHAKIDWVVEKRMKGVIAGSPVIDRIVEIDTHRWRSGPFSGLPRLFSQIGRIVARLRSSRYDVAIDFQGLIKSGLIALASGAPARVGFSRAYLIEPLAALFYTRRVAPDADDTHIISINNALVRALGVNVGAWEFPITTAPEDEGYILSQLRANSLDEFVVINPGAGWGTKLWGVEKYARLCDMIWDRLKIPCVITVSEEESRLLDGIVSSVRRARIVSFPTTIKQLIPLLKRARCFVGGDTGPLHIAAAVGAPVVGIYGPTAPARNGPFAAGDITVYKGVACSPCHKRTCPIRTNECMWIDVEQVWSALESRLNAYSRRMDESSIRSL